MTAAVAGALAAGAAAGRTGTGASAAGAVATGAAEGPLATVAAAAPSEFCSGGGRGAGPPGESRRGGRSWQWWRPRLHRAPGGTGGGKGGGLLRAPRGSSCAPSGESPQRQRQRAAAIVLAEIAVREIVPVMHGGDQPGRVRTYVCRYLRTYVRTAFGTSINDHSCSSPSPRRSARRIIVGRAASSAASG